MATTHGFFEGRLALNLKRGVGGGANIKFAEYRNIPPIIGTVISKRIATLHELDTVYGTRDLYDMLEVVTIDDYNKELLKRE